HLGGLAFDEELLPKRKGFLEKTVVVQKEREISFGGQVETITLEHTLPKRGGFNGFDPVFLVTGKDQDRAIVQRNGLIGFEFQRTIISNGGEKRFSFFVKKVPVVAPRLRILGMFFQFMTG